MDKDNEIAIHTVHPLSHQEVYTDAGFQYAGLPHPFRHLRYVLQLEIEDAGLETLRRGDSPLLLVSHVCPASTACLVSEQSAPLQFS